MRSVLRELVVCLNVNLARDRTACTNIPSPPIEWVVETVGGSVQDDPNEPHDGRVWAVAWHALERALCRSTLIQFLHHGRCPHFVRIVA